MWDLGRRLLLDSGYSKICPCMQTIARLLTKTMWLVAGYVGP